MELAGEVWRRFVGLDVDPSHSLFHLRRLGSEVPTSHAAEVLLREWEFSEFNADFPENVFAFEITEQDLAQLGVTRSELDALGEQAMSFQLTGATGAEIIGTLTDDFGTREVKGKLPFAIVQTQHGKLSFDFRMADGRARQFWLRYKNMPAPLFWTCKRITGWTSTNWAGEIRGEP